MDALIVDNQIEVNMNAKHQYRTCSTGFKEESPALITEQGY